jgi:signal transduction histidine kinase
MSLRLRLTPFTETERSRRTELVDAIAIWTAAVAAFIAIVYVVVLVFQFSVQFLILALLGWATSGGCLAVRALARRGRLELAAYLLLAALLVLMSFAPLVVEGIAWIAAVFYLIVIVAAGLMLGSTVSFMVAVLAGGLTVVVAILSRRSFIVPLALSDDWTLVLTSFLCLIVFIFVAYLGMLNTRDLRRSLRDATYDLVKANEELQEANRLKNRFLARVSHELRTPLNAIIGYTDMNLAGYYGALNGSQTDALERVQRNGRQLLLLINDVLDLSRIDAQGVELEGRAFSPQDLVLSVVSTVEPIVQEKGLELTYDVSPELPSTLVGDQVRLNQILTNLVDNAIKFTDVGTIHISAHDGDGDTWTVVVQDTGRGISERDLPRIFEEFHQGSPVYGRQSEGVGLGLTIAHRLVMAMGGEIRVHSRLGAGSTFIVRLPTALATRKKEEES